MDMALLEWKSQHNMIDVYMVHIVTIMWHNGIGLRMFKIQVIFLSIKMYSSVGYCTATWGTSGSC